VVYGKKGIEAIGILKNDQFDPIYKAAETSFDNYIIFPSTCDQIPDRLTCTLSFELIPSAINKI